MNKKIESIKGLIIWILSRSIVFNVSDVNGFADIAFGKAKKLKLKDIRFSLVFNWIRIFKVMYYINCT